VSNIHSRANKEEKVEKKVKAKYEKVQFNKGDPVVGVPALHY
jgi:ribosomal protein S17